MKTLLNLIVFNILPVLVFSALPKFAENNCPISLAKPAYATPTLPDEFPYMCAIGWINQAHKAREVSLDFKCGGALLNDKFVLTAAHCLYSSEASPDYIRPGGINLTDNRYEYTLDIAISIIFEHPDYNYPSSYNDIAVLKLAEWNKITTGLLEIKKFAHLPTRDALVNEVFTAIGYGDTRFGGTSTKQLLKIQVNAVSTEECRKDYQPDEIGLNLKHGIVDTQLCAVDPAKLMNTCQGDSGGPLIRQHVGIHYVMGVTSFGVGCENGPPGVYTRTLNYVDWIESKMRRYYNEDFPYTFGLFWINSKTCKPEKKRCGAVLIRWNFLLLPAHCLYDYEEIPRIFYEYRYDRGDYRLNDYYVHPEYDHPSPYNDLALLSIFFTPFFVTPIWLENRLVNQTLTSVNFADTSEVDKRTQNLLKTTLHLIPNSECTKYYKYHQSGNFTRGILDTQICAQDTEKRWDLKQGYSDGPLIMHANLPNVSIPYVVGVTVYARNCVNCPPGVFTRLSKYIDWIEKTVNTTT